MIRKTRRDKEILGKANAGGGNKESIVCWRPIEERFSREKK